MRLTHTTSSYPFTFRLTMVGLILL
uniref:Uncharacterized protein n=1 Tax=Rhizophora mucronata TaxID=61149 RepID=A0A2P2QAN9_RHIMU